MIERVLSSWLQWPVINGIDADVRLQGLYTDKDASLCNRSKTTIGYGIMGIGMRSCTVRKTTVRRIAIRSDC
jgi:hypothetical protein